jgi:ribonuclease HII
MTSTGGLDEVGWGALAGPIISVVAVFRDEDVDHLPTTIKDSKRTSEKQREMMYLEICRLSLDIGIGHAFPWEIDELGPMNALQLSYTRALEELKHKPDWLIVDGTVHTNKVRSWKGPQYCEPKADLNQRPVSAASMVAKVFRDRLMCQEAKRFPQYNWERNKGYGSRDHQEAIRKYGLIINEKRREFYMHRKCYCQRFMYSSNTTYHPGSDLEE